MGREESFEASLKKARRQIYYLLNEKTRKFDKELSERLARIFRDRARQRLIDRASPLTEGSEQLIDNLAASIEVRQAEGGYYSVRIPADPEGLFLFLEFGTGLEGQENIVSKEVGIGALKEADRVGWNYAGHSDKYYNGGWFFKYNKERNNYIDLGDIYPLERELASPALPERKVIVSAHSRLRGKFEQDVKSYERTLKAKPARYKKPRNTVFSKGIQPTRYIYDTIQEIKGFFDSLKRYKKLDPLTIISELNKLEDKSL